MDVGLHESIDNSSRQSPARAYVDTTATKEPRQPQQPARDSELDEIRSSVTSHKSTSQNDADDEVEERERKEQFNHLSPPGRKHKPPAIKVESLSPKTSTENSQNFGEDIEESHVSPNVSPNRAQYWNDGVHLSGESPRARRRFSSARSDMQYNYSTNVNRRKPYEDPGIDPDNTNVSMDSVGSMVTILDYWSHEYVLVMKPIPESGTQLDPHRRSRPSGDRPQSVSLHDEPSPRDTSQDSRSSMSHELDLESASLDELLAWRPSNNGVRWIVVNGYSSKAILPVAKRFKLHPLDVEAVMNPSSHRTRVESGSNYTSCVFPLHQLISQEKKSTLGFVDYITQIHQMKRNQRKQTHSHRSGLFQTIDDIPMKSAAMELEKEIYGSQIKSIHEWANAISPSLIREDQRSALDGSYVGVEKVVMVITDEDTVLTFFESSAPVIQTPILQRIARDSNLLLDVPDHGMLVQAILDAAVDLIYPILDTYRSSVNYLESQALLTPSVAHTRDLHLINSELVLLRNNVVSLSSLISSIREHTGSIDRSTLDRSSLDQDVARPGTTRRMGNMLFTPTSPTRVISDIASIYLSDVLDHVLQDIQDIDMMRNTCQGMINLIFNTITIQSNDSVRILSLVTVIFLPLTFLTGYYGMNFTDFHALHQSVDHYWAIAIPCSAILTVILLWQSFRDGVKKKHLSLRHSWQKFKVRRNAAKLKELRRASMSQALPRTEP